MAEEFEQGDIYEEVSDELTSEPEELWDFADMPEENTSLGTSYDKNKLMMIILASLVITLVVVVALFIFVKKPVEPETSEVVFQEVQNIVYTDSEKAILRSKGYTGSDIELYETSNLAVSDLVAEADKARQEYLNKTYSDILDGASDEYKELASKTWLDGSDINLVAGDSYANYTKKVNADYEKIDAKGSQLYIIVYLDSGKVFMSCTPDQYMGLEDSGNILVEVTSMLGNQSQAEVVTNVREIDF